MYRLALAALVAFVPSLLTAQKDKQPKRPALASYADTNDARAYYAFGLEKLKRDPDKAADAFYWSAILDPTSADAVYGRRIALLLTDAERLRRYWTGDRGVLRRPEIRAIDSLYLQALTLNPFFYEGLERELQNSVIRTIVQRASMDRGENPGQMQYEIDRYLALAGPGEQAFRAYTDGRFTDALKHYAQAIKEARYKGYYRNMRGRLFFQLGNADSALSELTLAVDDLRKRDAKDVVHVYESKALFEHSIGMAHERLGDTAKAREAYGRALQEDLSYSPAHLRLAYMAMDAKDTATALSEMDLAVQLRPDDSGLRYQYGFQLGESGRAADALVQLQKALELNPWYAAPHYGLGRVHEQLGKVAEAAEAYRRFLALAAKQDLRRGDVTRRIETLASK